MKNKDTCWMDPVIHRPVKHNYYIYWCNFSKTCKT